ncbi:hypothetical protein P3X46_027050 [Hevea brasiliensis]|uniref:Uncharacterized protein n=1 Tax=Hevea brasiliensis TaxID=3981 RepID=A0ABQ9L042_HEVBR|nr:hypothetical protein P3X46_027050 [Hevea brasiliensis]
MTPNLVKDAMHDVVEGDGGLVAVYLFNFGLERGRLDLGFSYHSTISQLTATREGETLIDVVVTYEFEMEDDTLLSMTSPSINYLVNAAS